MTSQMAELTIDFASGLVIYGPLGIGWLYFMWRDEKRDTSTETRNVATNMEIRGLSHRIHGLTTALIMDVYSRPTVSESTRRMAEELMQRANVVNPTLTPDVK